MKTDVRPDGVNRPTEIDRPGRVLLNPLADIGIRMLMPVCICRSQFMMHILCNGKRCRDKQQQDET